MRTWECVWADQWVCTRASKHVGTCVLLRYATNAGYWLVYVTFVGLLVIIIAFAVILSPFPLPIPCPTTLRPTSPVSSFPVEDHLVGIPILDHNGRAAAKPTISAQQRRICLSACWPLPAPCWRPLGGTPSLIARWQNLSLARGSADFVCLRAHHYLHHGPPRSHTVPRTLTTPLHATTLHSHLFPTHTVAPHSHLYFGYKNACPARTAGPRLSVH